MSSSPLINTTVTVSITIGIYVTFMFHFFFFNSLQGPGIYPSFHFLLILTCGQLGQQIPQFCNFFFVDYVKIWSSGRY